jgi:tetraprenyl-beta-curcumene synthase
MRIAAKETAAALAALIAYVATVLPRVRRELKRWRKLTEALPDPERRRQALAALEEKRSNVEAVAVFATLAPLRERHAVLRAIVPLQVAIDYRDTLEEAGETEDAPRDAYLTALETGWVREIECLAGCSAVAPLLWAAVDRCREGQRQTHAAAASDSAKLQRWASALPGSADYRWWELAAGASSSVAAHALIAAAADPATSAAGAATVAAAYDPPVGALTVLLDDLIDREADHEVGEHNYVDYYEDSDEAAERLARIANYAKAQLERLPRARRHRAILAGVGAFYLSDRGAEAADADPIRRSLLAALGSGTKVLALFMRARRLLGRKRPERAGNSPGP